MKIKSALAAAAACGALAVGAVVAAPTAGAWPTVGSFGTPANLYDGAGTIVSTWTVSNLKPSKDAIPYAPAGKLWEAKATVKATMGTVVPIISDMNARAANGDTYRVVFHVPTAEGVNPSTLAPGTEETGKLYFDVVGEKPNSVVYNNGVEDLLIWVK